MRVPRLSVRTLLVAVAVVALLIPFPWRALLLSIVTFALWVFVPVGLVLSLDSPGKARASLPAALVFVIAGSYFHRAPIYLVAFPIPLFIDCLTPVHLAGPIYAAWRLWRHKALFAGEILWAWVGLVWMVFRLSGVAFSRSHGGGSVILEILAEFARLTAVLAMLLALYGKRPSKPEPIWPHHLGWAVAECDVIAWGWYAVS